MDTTEMRTQSEVAKEVFARMNRRDADGEAELLDKNVDEYWPVVGRLQGAKAVHDHLAALFASVPDFNVDIEHMTVDGETVFVQWRMTGHGTGAPYYGLATSGREFDLRGINCFTIRDGKVTGNHVAYDGITWAVQAGILPAPGSRMDRLFTHLINVRTRAMRVLHR